MDLLAVEPLQTVDQHWAIFIAEEILTLWGLIVGDDAADNVEAHREGKRGLQLTVLTLNVRGLSSVSLP